MTTRTLFLWPILLLSLNAFSAEPSWPCYHGPRRDNKSEETGLLKEWPKAGPKLLWKTTGIGHGYSAVAATDGRIFTAGMLDEKTHVVAVDLNGKILWKRVNGASWKASAQQSYALPYDGARGTPTVDGDTVYHLSEMGGLTAFDVSNGNERWKLNVTEAFQGERQKYGLCDSVLIHGDHLICSPGGAKGYTVALDKKKGRIVWANTEISDPVGYCSPVVAEIDGVEQVLLLSSKRVFALQRDNGKLLWQHPCINQRHNNATDVIVRDGLVFVSSGYGGGSSLLKPTRQADDGFEVTEVWKTDLMDNHHGGVVLVGDHLFGSGHYSRGWFCLEFKTGKKRWQERGKGSLTYADGKLYCLEEKGTLNLIDASATKWNATGSFTVPDGGRGPHWAHPVVCGGRLYVRHSETLFAYQLRE